VLPAHGEPTDRAALERVLSWAAPARLLRAIPAEVDVHPPSAALTARAEAQGALNSLFLGLGAVSLLVGAVGVANIMLIGVLERRSEIGLRRSLGATERQIRTQFLAEAILQLLGGGAGVTAGAISTVVYASTKHWTAVVPASAWAGGLVAAILIGAIAGLLPAIRAAQLSPTEALRTVWAANLGAVHRLLCFGLTAGWRWGDGRVRRWLASSPLVAREESWPTQPKSSSSWQT
jgi:predicted lysophospholipase L1 biosynthesis ABC-type transport system permease subunit